MLRIYRRREWLPFKLPMGDLRGSLVGSVDDGTRPGRPGRHAEIWVRRRWGEGSVAPQGEKVRKTAMHGASQCVTMAENITAIFDLL
jgi:hypothetical protein